MFLYADTANLTEISYLNDLGVIQGVTTNPSIISKEPKGDFVALINPIGKYCKANSLSLSVEVFNIEYDAMLKEAIDLSSKLAEFGDLVKIKIPLTHDGLRVIKKLRELNIKTNATACYTEQQLILAASAGAEYVSLFYCRLDQSGGDVKKVLERTKNYILANSLKTKIIAGSIRTQTDVSNAWRYGADIVTTSKAVIDEMIPHPKTDEAIYQFTRDFSAWLK